MAKQTWVTTSKIAHWRSSYRAKSGRLRDRTQDRVRWKVWTGAINGGLWGRGERPSGITYSMWMKSLFDWLDLVFVKYLIVSQNAELNMLFTHF